MNKKINRVILIDDSESDNFIHKKLFEESGCTTEIVIMTSAANALDYLVKNQEKHTYPGMILLDVNMPRMDGWDFIKEYKKLPEETQTAYVLNIFTNSSKLSDMDKASKTHIKSYVKKPLSISKIENLMKLHFTECL